MVVNHGTIQGAVHLGGADDIYNGNGGTALTAAGTDNSTAGTAGQLLGADLFLYVNDPSSLLNSDELARVADTVTGIDNLLAPYSVTITEVSDATLANLILDTGTTSAVCPTTKRPDSSSAMPWVYQPDAGDRDTAPLAHAPYRPSPTIS